MNRNQETRNTVTVLNIVLYSFAGVVIPLAVAAAVFDSFSLFMAAGFGAVAMLVFIVVASRRVQDEC